MILSTRRIACTLSCLLIVGSGCAAWAAAGDLVATSLLGSMPGLPSNGASAAQRVQNNADTALRGKPERIINRLDAEIAALTRSNSNAAQAMAQNAASGNFTMSTNSAQIMMSLASCTQDMGSRKPAEAIQIEQTLSKFEREIGAVRGGRESTIKKCPTDAHGFPLPACVKSANESAQQQAAAKIGTLPGIVNPIFTRWTGAIRSFAARCERPAHAGIQDGMARSQALGLLMQFAGWVRAYAGARENVAKAMAGSHREFSGLKH